MKRMAASNDNQRAQFGHEKMLCEITLNELVQSVHSLVPGGQDESVEANTPAHEVVVERK